MLQLAVGLAKPEAISLSLPTQPMLFCVDPLQDPRWPRFVDGHPKASVFHTPEWLRTLVSTYGYRTLVFTSNGPGLPLTNGVVCCQVNSWLTGQRLVSLPFSDHCDPLANSADELEGLLSSFTRVLEKRHWKYIELRPHSTLASHRVGFKPSQTFYFHSIDLRPSIGDLFHNFHRSCIQRKIHRANREGLTYEEGRSETLLNGFYHLLLLTRRRHELPPQPLAWFRNLVDCMGEKSKMRVCYKNGQPIAAIITLMHKNSMVYKYGCSDARFHNLGAMPYLFWKAIRDAKQGGVLQFDLGRCDCENDGLRAFKEHLGAKRSLMTYFAVASGRNTMGWKLQLSKSLFRWMPSTLLRFTGEVLYRHIG
jgi:hypothetical protein